MKRLSIALFLAPLAGCYPSTGDCDQEAVFDLAYDSSGSPVFAGQAIMIQSCGAGGFCHSEGIDIDDRFGAPAGLSFDLRIASGSADYEPDAVERLLAHQRNVLNNRGLVWEQISSGRMPPDGEAGETYAMGTADFVYERVAEDGLTFSDLPRVDTEEGRDIVRNWLACGAPAIERTNATYEIAECDLRTWFEAPNCEQRCVDPTFESIYRQILRPNCTLSRCHDGEEAEGMLDLISPLTAEAPPEEITPAALAEIFGRLDGEISRGEQCSGVGMTLVAPHDGDPLPGGDPALSAASLLFLKVRDPECVADTDCPSDFTCVDFECQGAACTDNGDCPGGTCRDEFCRRRDAGSYDVCGAPMPAAGNRLTPQRLCAMQEWLECGACDMDDASDPECAACLANARTICGVASPFDAAIGSAECMNVEPCADRWNGELQMTCRIGD